MEIGKLSNEVLKELVLDKILSTRPEVVLRPGIGEDCSVVDLKDKLCVLSSDPITGAVNHIGRLAVHVSCNDIASSGAEPLGLLVTLLAPPDAEKKDIEKIMEQLCHTANMLNVDIIGGHTEITDAVNRFVICSTCIGKVAAEKLVTSSGATADSFLVLTKYAGLEGTSILAHDLEDKLSDVLGHELLERAKGFINEVSVVKEGLMAANYGVDAMHDVTEGGVLGAVWEMCEASGVGAVIYKDSIPIDDVTLKICNHLKINPLKLISSGSMLIACRKPDGLVALLKEHGINASVIGKTTREKEKIIIEDGKAKAITPPTADELYKAIGS